MTQISSNGNGNGNGGIHLPLVISTVIVLLTVLGGFWSLADPRADIKEIRSSFLSLREHIEFVARVNKDIARLETEQDHQDAKFQTQLNARQSKEAADQATLRVEQRITDLATETHELRKMLDLQKILHPLPEKRP